MSTAVFMKVLESMPGRYDLGIRLLTLGGAGRAYDRLAECDWVTLKAIDASNDNLGIQLPQVWIIYRQALRDITAQAGFPWNVTWPTKPA